MPTIIANGRQVPVGDRETSEQLAQAILNRARQKKLGQLLMNTPGMSDRNFAEKLGREPSQPKRSWSEMPGNIVPSAVNTATGLWDMVTHPQRTAETLVDAAQGGVDRIMPEEFTNFMDTHISPRSPETRERQRQISGAVGQALKDRYWGFENLKNTMITDPVGIALDVGGIAAGGIGAVRGPLSIGSRARLAETPAAMINTGRPSAIELGQMLTADAKREKIYAPPTKPQRPFEADYTKSVQANEVNEAGDLLVDRRNRPFNPGDAIFGRRTLGGDDVRASHGDFRKIGERILRKPVTVVPRSHIEGRSGRVTYNPDTNEPIDMFRADDLDMTKPRSKHISDHEASHLMDLATGHQSVPPSVWEELESVYSTLATGKENLPTLTGPANRGYNGPAIRDELVAEGVRASLADPNYMKTVAPKAYDWIADLLAKNP